MWAAKWFKLTLRDFFWLTVLVAVNLGWWINRQSTFALLENRLQEMYKTADQMAFFIQENGLGRVGYGEHGVIINGKPIPREVDWTQLSSGVQRSEIPYGIVPDPNP